APRCPCTCRTSRRRVKAASWSRCRLVPHSGQRRQRTDRSLATSAPQPEHAWLVHAGVIACTRFSAPSALYVSIDWNAPPPTPACMGGRAVPPRQGVEPRGLAVDHLVGCHQPRRFPMLAVAPLVADPLTYLRQRDDCLAPAVARLLATGNAPSARTSFGVGLV